MVGVGGRGETGVLQPQQIGRGGVQGLGQLFQGGFFQIDHQPGLVLMDGRFLYTDPGAQLLLGELGGLTQGADPFSCGHGTSLLIQSISIISFILKNARKIS